MQYWLGKQEGLDGLSVQGSGLAPQLVVEAPLGETWAATAAHPSSYRLPSQPQVGF